MTWSDYCGDNTVEGKLIEGIASLYTDGLDKRGLTGLPDGDTMRALVAQANGLALTAYKKPKGDKSGRVPAGISFHVARLNRQGNLVNVASRFDEFVSRKPSARVCYEDTFLPVDMGGDGYVIVHQSLAPCTRCRAGYKAWAMERRSAIVVAADEGYDRSGNDRTFIFCPTGYVMYG